MIDLLKTLSRHQSYDGVFERLRRKAEIDPFRLQSAPVESDISLHWLLFSQDRITRYLVREIRARRFFPEACNLNIVMLDKPRELYSLAWPDRIVEALLAHTLQQIFEPRFSDALYSFRKGRNNLLAVRRVAEWVTSGRRAERRLFVVKRDIAKFGESIDPSQVMTLLQRELGPQDDYIWRLFHRFLSPHYTKDGLLQAPRPQGLPTGFALTPICENLLLNQLDHSLAQESELLYMRFGDDLLLMHHDPESLAKLADRVELELLNWRLQFNRDKSLNIELCSFPHRLVSQPQFIPKPNFDYLGFRVNSAGKIWISTRKQKELKKEFRQLARRAFYAARQVESTIEGIIRAMISNLNFALDRRTSHAYIGLLLATTTDLEALEKFDRWIAKQILTFVYGGAHDRVFRYRSLETLRTRDGLRSLVHMQKARFRQQTTCTPL